MTSVVHVARFGRAESGGHDLLEQTGADTTAVRSLTYWTDLPPQGDGQNIKPFLAGYPVQSLYVVQRTELDRESDRAGMVRTTALLFELEAVSSVDLQPAFDLLKSRADLMRPQPVENFHEGGESRSAEGIESLVSGLIRSGQAAWIGDGAYSAIAELWRHLDGEDRLRLRFGLVFHPSNISLPDAEITVAIVPERYAIRWQDWPIAGADRESGDRAAADLLRERAEATPNLFGRSVPLREWRFAATAKELLARLPELDHEETRSLAQLVARLSPRLDGGSELKQKIVERLGQLTSAATLGDVRGLRTVPWEVFAAESLDELLRAWAARVVEESQKRDLIAALTELLGERDEHSVNVVSALTVAVRGAPDAAARHFAWLVDDPIDEPALRWMIKQLGVKVADENLASVLNERVSPRLTVIAKKMKMSRVFASLVDLTDPIAAWSDLLAMNPGDAARKRMSERCSPSATVSASLVLDDPGLTDRGAELVVNNPELIANEDLRNDGVLRLLSAVARRGSDPWTVIPVRNAARAVLDRVAAGETVEPELLAALADSPGADITDFPQRAAIWPKVSDDVREKLLAATAPTIAETLTPGAPPVEPEVVNAILDRQAFGALAHDNPVQALVVLRVLPNAGASHAILLAERGRLTASSAQELGDVIVERRWKEAVEDLAALARDRSDLRPAADRAAKLLNFVERLALHAKVRGLSWMTPTATKKDRRDALQELVVTLYPKGPDEEGIWERAGGSPADIPGAGTPRKQWNAALRQIVDGASGAPSDIGLVAAMRMDYPNNNNLRGLEELLRSEGK